MNNGEKVMKNMKYKVTFGTALVCAMLFTACDNFVEPPEIQIPVESGYGRISISFAEGEATQTARTVLPSTTFYRYTYTFTKAGAETGVVIAPDNDGFFTLEIGSYTVEVQAFTGNEEPYTLAASGLSSEFSVGSGDNDPVEIILTGVGTDTQGKFSYTITYPADAVAEITLQKWPGLDEITLNPVDITEGNGKTQTLQLETGSYLLTVLVSKTGLYAGINEAVHIYSSLVTVYTKNYDDNDFLSNPGAAVNAPTLNGATQDSITINPVEPPDNEQIVEYGINTTNSVPSSGWQTGTTFSGLTSGTTYYIFARSAPNADYKAGPASASLQVTTNVIVSFDINNGSGTVPSTQAVSPGSSITLPNESGLSRSGYTFGGWNTNTYGTGTNYAAGSSYTPTGNVILYAVWTNTVTYDINGGTGTTPSAQTANAGNSVTLASGSGLSRTGYIFGGWNTNADGTMGTNYSTGSSYTPAGDITLYARWYFGGTEDNPIPLTVNSWVDGSITSINSAVWYSFNVDVGPTYYVWWNDGKQGNGTKTLDVKVSAYTGNNTTSWDWFTGIDSAWTNWMNFYFSSGTGQITVKFKVEPYTSGSTGTFSIVYSTGSTRP
jgi:uncharacterized repeat protein (TIGR02543 family)